MWIVLAMCSGVAFIILLTAFLFIRCTSVFRQVFLPCQFAAQLFFALLSVNFLFAFSQQLFFSWFRNNKSKPISVCQQELSDLEILCGRLDLSLAFQVQKAWINPNEITLQKHLGSGTLFFVNCFVVYSRPPLIWQGHCTEKPTD